MIWWTLKRPAPWLRTRSVNSPLSRDLCNDELSKKPPSKLDFIRWDRRKKLLVKREGFWCHLCLYCVLLIGLRWKRGLQRPMGQIWSHVINCSQGRLRPSRSIQLRYQYRLLNPQQWGRKSSRPLSVRKVWTIFILSWINLREDNILVRESRWLLRDIC